MQETSIQRDVIPFPPMRIAQEVTIDRARDVLDWLEAHGVEQADVEIDSSERVSIILKN